ncbi:hypothetical protein AC579_852 [Pseudocercospora musae]|uniref:Uncharacterized protein n=1 Tax=Pseudocercospora musae TaxID=113226 RepID=A0A139HU61_9PEZI|nr:hypothetical protein AC579_852 [Pseudocercospora musae]
MPEMMLNFGVWGPGPSKYEDAVAWNRAFEAEIHALSSQKWLEKYHATSLPSIYNKVKADDSGSAAIPSGRSRWYRFTAMF